ncbi:hypothetical protein DPEC_G00124840 [Dallia pectoralis]|uniref:Uncharacterized protein n=1 Tax=Dallia pectoralis TaxID=75939 RepID=A0ACC2GR02_DALPE|nr:hypothetical protein DPEC_G00124840 [Dallia pectoralis]
MYWEHKVNGIPLSHWSISQHLLRISPTNGKSELANRDLEIARSSPNLPSGVSGWFYDEHVYLPLSVAVGAPAAGLCSELRPDIVNSWIVTGPWHLEQDVYVAPLGVGVLSRPHHNSVYLSYLA